MPINSKDPDRLSEEDRVGRGQRFVRKEGPLQGKGTAPLGRAKRGQKGR